MLHCQTIDLSNPLWRQTLQTLRHDVYHLPEYLALEAKRTNALAEAVLIQDGAKIFFLPYLIRRCDDLFGSDWLDREIFDVVSPYGYPGILMSPAAVDSPSFLNLAMQQFIQLLRSQKICSAFLRLHPILNSTLPDIYSSDICQVTGETISIDLTLTEEDIWQQTRSDHRKDINRQKRSGSLAQMLPFAPHFDEFIAIYEETMDRTGAAKLYYFGRDFFAGLLALGEKLHLGAVEIEGEIASCCLITECCGIVQTYLGGTKNKFLKQTPDKLLFDHVRFWAKTRGNQVFHLGGGVGSAQDGVYNFKAGFSKQRSQFSTLRLITDSETYLHLVNARAKYLKTDPEQLMQANFFPAYRIVRF
jgi:Acetyltransferase (GNAT) domain